MVCCEEFRGEGREQHSLLCHFRMRGGAELGYICLCISHTLYMCHLRIPIYDLTCIHVYTYVGGTRAWLEGRFRAKRGPLQRFQALWAESQGLDCLICAVFARVYVWVRLVGSRASWPPLLSVSGLCGKRKWFWSNSLILSDKICLLIRFRKSTPPQNRQVKSSISGGKQYVDNFVGELSLYNKSINTFCEIRVLFGNEISHNNDNNVLVKHARVCHTIRWQIHRRAYWKTNHNAA